ncbi:hypothetical protein [Dendrosporobacter quercicolus]|uniref:hypothetical protein n=1 Tax=Dendrosporobacter quercicolus TaxID=146817 RepID=UPI001FDF5597|nr:hypothetical protein [Dendrosporobacter quercicolus]
MFYLAQLSQLELQHLRHMIGGHETMANKLEAYAQQCSDTQIKQMFQQDAAEAKSSKQKLMTFLQ